MTLQSDDEFDWTWRDRLSLRWWKFRTWFHRCPECKHRPDRHFDGSAPRWEDDKIAKMLGIGQYGCRRCGHGSITNQPRT
jgi:hypothetical protein